ncbi:MAG: hypothetical protein EA397_19735 [Deltaproteobacteria bacterium]|nr:MAG: hypothetical protein EA397_19735 [Deltaproteobacteria bacterium]
MKAIQCDGCGGGVGVVIGKPEPACLFCGSTALVPVDPDLEIEHASASIPFSVDKAKADEGFRVFAKSSFFYPPAIRRASLTLRPLLVPAWSWSGALETTYTGLRRAATRSGKAPVAGSVHLRFDQVVVPASKTLSQTEMNGLGRWEEGALSPFDEAGSDVPFEIAELSRQAARSAAITEMERRAERIITAEEHLIKTLTSGIPHDLDGGPVLLPVWIGAYRYKDVSYRVLVNGQTGLLHGQAPLDWLRVAAVGLGVLLAVALAIGLILGLFVILD